MVRKQFAVSMDEGAVRSLLLRKMPGVSESEVAGWMSIEPRAWVIQHGPSLYAAGLSAEDAKDLYRRLGVKVAAMLSPLIDAGRMADINIRYIHLWAASGLLRPEAPQGRGRNSIPKFTRWVSQARRYIMVCEGDQRLAALAAAAGLSVEETVAMRDAGDLDPDALAMLGAFREADYESD